MKIYAVSLHRELPAFPRAELWAPYPFTFNSGQNLEISVVLQQKVNQISLPNCELHTVATVNANVASKQCHEGLRQRWVSLALTMMYGVPESGLVSACKKLPKGNFRSRSYAAPDVQSLSARSVGLGLPSTDALVLGSWPPRVFFVVEDAVGCYNTIKGKK